MPYSDSTPPSGAKSRPAALSSAGRSDGATDRSLSSFPAPVLPPEHGPGSDERERSLPWPLRRAVRGVEDQVGRSGGQPFIYVDLAAAGRLS